MYISQQSILKIIQVIFFIIIFLTELEENNLISDLPYSQSKKSVATNSKKSPVTSSKKSQPADVSKSVSPSSYSNTVNIKHTVSGEDLNDNNIYDNAIIHQHKMKNHHDKRHHSKNHVSGNRPRRKPSGFGSNSGNKQPPNIRYKTSPPPSQSYKGRSGNAIYFIDA